VNSCSDRTTDIAFIGTPYGDRNEVIEEVRRHSSHFLYLTKDWNCITSLSTSECSDIYFRSKYVPCPSGVNIETFRVCEALEWGCIPIVKRSGKDDYFKNIFGDHPFKVVDHWSEIADILKDDEYCKSKDELIRWYATFKKSLQERIISIISTSDRIPRSNEFDRNSIFRFWVNLFKKGSL
jgi:hypothetical protein